MLLAALVMAGSLTSCSDESPWSGSDSEGGVRLSLSTDGRVMRNGTRADDNQCPYIPEVSSFRVSMTNADGSFSKQWDNIDLFNKEDRFSIGDYQLKAFYGDMNQEGFALPYYEGVADVHIAPGELTQTEVTATLANTMVSIRYTEAFTRNFKAWSAAVQTEGHTDVVFAQNETRPAFIDPTAGSEVKFKLTMTNMEDKTVTVEPAKFTAQARHHYIVTVNATGDIEKGDLTLDLQFDDNVVTESVDLNLGDDLFNAPAPEVKLQGVTADQLVETITRSDPGVDPMFNIVAYGGFKEVNLNIVTDVDFNLSTGGKAVNLAALEPLQQAQIANDGIEVFGIYHNSDKDESKMAVVKVKKFLEKLPAGEYTIQMSAVDNKTQTSEPVSFKVKVSDLAYTLEHVGAIPFGSTQTDVTVNTNAAGIKDKLTFTVSDVSGNMVQAKVKSVTGPTANAESTDESLKYQMVYTLEIPAVSTPTIKIAASVETKSAEVVVNVEAPEYTLTADAFAKTVVFKVESEIANVCKNLKFYDGEMLIPESRIKRDATNGLIYISGLNAATAYTTLKSNLNGFAKPVAQFTTEPATDITNGNFSDTDNSKAININEIKSGGAFNGTASSLGPWYYLYTSIVRNVPSGWATINDKTCYSGSSQKNTWYMEPSTWIENGAVLQTVGYSHSGPEVGKTKGNIVYYSTWTPDRSSLTASAGELFLGSYSYVNGTESRTDGIAWSTRPSTLSFNYTYESQNGEKGEVYIRIYDASGNIIAEQTKKIDAGTSISTLNFGTKYPFGVKAAKIALCFKSTASGTADIYVKIPTGSGLKEDVVNGLNMTNSKNHPIPANEYKAKAVGSKLTISNVKLGYEGAVSVTKAPRRNHRK